MEKISTIIADGNEIFRHGLRSILSEHHCDVVSETDNGALVLSAFENVRPQLCVLSFNLPEISGIHLANKLVEKFPDARVLILADDSKEETLNDFLASGAQGLLMKSAHRIELIDAASKVAEGDTYLGKIYSKMMTREYRKLTAYRKSKKTITRREREVLHLLIQGNTSTEIASKLFISPRTVDKHRTNLLKKLNLKNTASLVRFALENKNNLEHI
jgi:DNA-binding NarL/FixJ family response regulator